MPGFPYLSSTYKQKEFHVLYLTLVAIVALLGVIGCYPTLLLFAFIGLLAKLFPTVLVLPAVTAAAVWVFHFYRR